mmetsp:Transcript_25823/g.33862  ORF Transcript_25823/g.33862 Transcript_25823/m.33862 type:complete len:882 (-) Transcript_25823:116-2761(-)
MQIMLKHLSKTFIMILFCSAVRSYIPFRIPSISRHSLSSHASHLKSYAGKDGNDKGDRNLIDQASAASVASAAAVAVAAVNQAVGMRTLEAPDNKQSYVQAGTNSSEKLVIDEVGLPLVYDKDAIQNYWSNQSNALTKRWAEFLGLSLPLFTKVVSVYVRDGSLNKKEAELAKDAREVIEKLGPTYVKMGQMMSVRPDVLPPAALDELKQLQDNVEGFATEIAIQQIESELGGPLGQFFSEISYEPVAAASLAQVYKAKLASTGEEVAVKVQRPSVLETVSKDLYVLRRAAAVYQGVIDRFAPQQRTDYEALLNEWAVGFYTELNFINEGKNQMKFREILNGSGIYVPKVYEEYTTRRVLVTEWINGEKLSASPPDDIKELTKPAQESFLTQLLQAGFFHADPHPGNIMVMDEPKGKARMALIDYGLVATINQQDMDTMVSSLIHLANKDYVSLVDDFISLGILPYDCDRSLVVPLMDKALSPYVKGGGAKKYELEIRKQYGMDEESVTVGALQAMTNDALTVLNDIPFSIPPYFAILGRAIVTLEGVALAGDPEYSIIMESYPFVARKLLSEDRPEIQRALQEVLYSSSQNDGSGLRTSRLTALLNAAMGVASKQGGEKSAFIDLDSEEELDLTNALQYISSNEAASLRSLLEDEAVLAIDVLLRQSARKGFGVLSTAIQTPRLPVIGRFLPFNPIPKVNIEEIQLPFLIPKPSLIPSAFSSMVAGDRATAASSIINQGNGFSTVFMTPKELLEIIAPRLSREEELYALSLTDLVKESFGEDAGVVVNGDILLEPRAAVRFFLQIAQGTSLSSSALFDVLTSVLNTPGRNLEATQEQQLEELLTAYNTMSEENRSNLQNTLEAVVQKLSVRLEERLSEIS